MNKNILLYLVVGILTTFSACKDPEYVLPTAESQGITSLTAIFTEGTYVDKPIAEYKIADPTASRFVIPIPFYYPESSDNETESYMKNFKVQAELTPNYLLSPSLGILDLTKDNSFTLTEPDGSKRTIVITGERVKSSACQITSFGLISPEVTGIINQTTKTISIITSEDLSSCLAEVGISAHASISPDPSAAPLNYNEDEQLTVTAHDGTTKQTYTIKKEVPPKISYGFTTSSVELLFNLDTDVLGIPWLATNAPSLGAINNHLVVCMGDGTTPMYFNRETGIKIGTINLGSAKASSITSDEANNLLIINAASGGETCNIYTTSSVTQAPTLFYSFTNSADVPLGSKVKVIGNIKQNALITLTNDGISGVTSSSKFTRIVVKDGVAQSPQVVDISSTGLSWGAAPVNTTTVVPASVNVGDGNFLSYYSDNTFTYLNGSNALAAQLANPQGASWGQNQNCLDSKQFNNSNYVALFIVSHFPHWGIGPQLYLYDVTDKSQLTGDITNSPALVLKNDAINWFQASTTGTASGDVLIAPTADGYKIYIYYYDNNSGVIGGYVADCIDD